MSTPPVPAQHYTDEYFDKWNYSDRPLGKYSMYWFARRYFAALIRRYAPPGGSERRLVEMGSGLGDLLMLLQDDFTCTGIDLIPRSIENTHRIAPKVEAILGDATDFSRYQDGELSVVVALHLVISRIRSKRSVILPVHCVRAGCSFSPPHTLSMLCAASKIAKRMRLARTKRISTVMSRLSGKPGVRGQDCVLSSSLGMVCGTCPMSLSSRPNCNLRFWAGPPSCRSSRAPPSRPSRWV